MKKNIFISCALIVLAVLAGCTPQSNYPAFPQSVVLTQKGDFIKGQDFDASKFEVVVTYLDGSKETLKDAALTYTDTAAGTAGVSADDKVAINVGNDYYGKAVETEANISRVYTIDSISAALKTEGAITVDDVEKLTAGTATADSALFTVTASYNGNSAVLPAESYSVTVKAETVDAEADEVAAVATISLNSTSNIGKANTASTELAVKISKTAETPASTEVKTVNSVVSTSYAIPAYNYDGKLPEIDATEVIVNVTYADDTTKNVYANTVDGIELFWADPATGKELNTAYISTDFAGNAKDGAPAASSTIAVGAKYKEAYAEDVAKVGIEKTSITLTYFGADLVAGDEAADLKASDFRALLKVGEAEFSEEIAITENMLQVKPNTGVLGSGDVVYVSVVYNGLSSNELSLSVKAAETAKVQSITATTVEGLVGPAKQYYTAIADVKPTSAIAADYIASVTITTDQGSKTITAADTEWSKVAIANAYSLSNTADKALAKGDDIMNASAIYLKVTYDSATSGYVEIPFSTAVATGVALSADYGKVAYYGAPVDWTIQLTNDWGIVNNDYTGAYTAYSVDSTTSKKAELPEILSTAGSYKVAVVLDGNNLVESEDVALVEGTAWYDVENLTATYSGDKVYIGDALSGVDENDFTISGATYKGTGEGTPLTASSVTIVEGETVEASNTVYVVVTYFGQDLKSHTARIPATVTGTAWVEGESASATLKYGDDLLSTTSGSGTEIPAGTYTWEDFTSSLKEHGAEVTFTATGIAGGFTPASNGFSIEQYADGSITMTWTNKTGEQSKTFYVHGGAAPAEEA